MSADRNDNRIVQSTELSADVLYAAINDLRAEGYTVAIVSGGEPTLYKPLRKVLEHAHHAGMITVVISNGLTLDETRLEMLHGVTDILTISLDGTPESHNKNRFSAGAFSNMAARLEGVRQSGIPFGFVFTLTQYNLDELDWVANFALEQGARLLQIRPLERVGRAKFKLPNHMPDATELAFAFLEAARLQNLAGERMLIHLDATTRHTIQDNPEQVYADGIRTGEESIFLSDIVSPLIIEADGTVSPLEYGIDRRYALGNLNASPLSQLSAAWRRDVYPAFVALCAQVYREVTGSTRRAFLNWYELVARTASV